MLHLLDPNNPDAPFPDINLAEKEPNGLLALGGDLSPKRLINAYRHGVFPWYSDDQPILWWSPDPRTVLLPKQFKVSRSLQKTLRNKDFTVSFDRHFDRIVQSCASPRDDGNGTWITAEMEAAYMQLHEQQIAHSVEVWFDGKLVGGLYGVAIGRVFFGESMFSKISDASKVGFVHLTSHLIRWGYQLIDCQVYSSHLSSLGAQEISRNNFSDYLKQWCNEPSLEETWLSAPESPLYALK